MRLTFRTQSEAAQYLPGQAWTLVGTGSQGGDSFYIYRNGPARGVLLRGPNGKSRFCR